MMSNSGSGGALSDDATSGMGGSGGTSQGLKKGPWTTAEDAVLVEYVRRHGEGNWNSVQKNSGLSRCGKSCRLRWANHLRPNLKKGAFSPEEERLIVELHAKLGNKWARMAAQLPGRTDNEIKNYWNTRMKRRQRAGLPLYPQGVQKEAVHQQQQQQQQHQQPVPPNSSSSIFPPFMSSSHQQRKPSFNPTLSLFDQPNFTTSANPISNHANSSFLSNPSSQFKFFHNNSTSYAMPLSPVSPFQSPISTLYTHSLTSPQLLSQSPVQFNSGSFDNSFNVSQPIIGSQFHSIGEVPGMNLKLAASLSPLQQTTPDSSGAAIINGTYVVAPPLSQDTSGLLDDMLKEAETLSRNENSKEENRAVQFGNSLSEDYSMALSNKGKHLQDGIVQNRGEQRMGSAYGDRQAPSENQWADSDAAQAHAGMKRKKEPVEEVACMDDDLLSLLDWHHGCGDVSIVQLTSGVAASLGLDHTSAFSAPTATTTTTTAAAAATTSSTNTNLKPVMESCEWYTMPSIC